MGVELINGVSTIVKCGILADATGRWSVNLGAVSDVQHQLQASAVDGAGNLGAASGYVFVGSSGSHALVGTGDWETLPRLAEVEADLRPEAPFLR